MTMRPQVPRVDDEAAGNTPRPGLDFFLEANFQWTETKNRGIQTREQRGQSVMTQVTQWAEIRESTWSCGTLDKLGHLLSRSENLGSACCLVRQKVISGEHCVTNTEE